MSKPKSKSTVNAAGNYTKPTMRKTLFNKIKAGSSGGDAAEEAQGIGPFSGQIAEGGNLGEFGYKVVEGEVSPAGRTREETMTTPNDPKGAADATMQPEVTSHRITFKQMRRLVSENPRIVEYCFSDRPDEIFTSLDLLMKHRGLNLEELKQTVTFA